MPSVSGSLPSLGYRVNLVVALSCVTANVCVIAALHGRLLCVMLDSLYKVGWIVLTKLNEE